MLSGIASMLFGASDEALVDDVNLKTTQVDNEWTLVDKDDGSSSTDSIPELVSSNGIHTKHVTSKIEESWLVTPPPCFNAGPTTSSLETSSMENLLIEHPSMSVYNTRGRARSIGHDSNSESSSEDLTGRSRRQRAAALRPPRRPQVLAQRAGLIAQVQVRSMQRSQQITTSKSLSKNRLDRANKVHHYSLRSGSNVLRRNNFMHQPVSASKRC